MSGRKNFYKKQASKIQLKNLITKCLYPDKGLAPAVPPPPPLKSPPNSPDKLNKKIK